MALLNQHIWKNHMEI